MHEKHVVIVGAGFVGLNCAKGLGNVKGVRVTVLDRRNHHLFQPLLYQVAMAGLNPADIAAPIRTILSRYGNITVLQSVVSKIDREKQIVYSDAGEITFDYLVVATGVKHSYFGNPQWEEYAPGLKTLAQATEIRRRVLLAFEEAEKTNNREQQKKLLTFVIVGGGPTGVELAGAIGEMSRHTLAKDFRNIDFRLTRVILVEGGPRILPSFTKKHSAYATRSLEKLGVQIWVNSIVSDVNVDGVQIAAERIRATTVLWAAGVEASSLPEKSGWHTDHAGRAQIEPDLSLPGFANIFAAGDMAYLTCNNGNPLPAMAPVAMQQGNYLATLIKKEVLQEKDGLYGQSRKSFRYLDKGQMATIGRTNAVLESGKLHLAGFSAWLAWVVIHIYYLTGFRNRFFVVLSWFWSHLNFKRGTRLIVKKEWRFWNKSDS